MAWCAFALLILLAGCERNDKIVSLREPKDPPPMAMDNTAETLALPQMPGGTYTKPESWVVRQPHEFELMRFSISDASDTVCTLATVQTFDWPPNVVRWENQVQMANTTADELPKIMPTKVGGISGQKIELQGGEKRLVATVVPMTGQFFFFKIIGAIDEVKGAQSDYDAFLNSVQFGASGSPSVAPQTSDAAGPPFTWTAPPAWKADPDQIEFRTAGWTVGGPPSLPDGGKYTEITISKPFTAAAFDLAANMHQWRQQVGLPDSADGKDVQLTTTQIGDQPAVEIDLTGPGFPDHPARRLIVAFTGNQSLYFFKIIGPSDVVAQQKPAFDQLLSSVKFKTVP